MGFEEADDPAFLRQWARGLARAFRRSPEHVTRIVKEHLGVTSSEIITARRMTLASRMLLSTNQSVEAVGLTRDLENQSYVFRLLVSLVFKTSSM